MTGTAGSAVAPPILPQSLVLVTVLAALVGAMSDGMFGALLGVLHRTPSVPTLAEFHAVRQVAWWVALGAAGGAVLSGALWTRIAPALDTLARRLQGVRHDSVFDFVAALIVLTMAHGASLVSGELRGDDYLFLSDVHLPLLSLLLKPWTGHVFPLWRLETVALHHWFGASPVPYRLWLFGNVLLLAWLNARMLAAWGLSRFARALGIVLFCGWTSWAQITMGYWTLSICVKVWAFVCVAVIAASGDDREERWRKPVLALAALGAILADSTGVVVVPAITAAAVAGGARRGHSMIEALRRSGWSFAIALCCAVAFFLGQHLARLDLAAVAGSLPEFHLRSAIGEWFFLLTFGTVGSFVAPVITTQLSPAVIFAFELVVPVAITAGLVIAWRGATRAERCALGFFCLMLASSLAMLVIGRPYKPYEFMLRWTHYLLFLYLPAVGVLAVAWQLAQRRVASLPSVELQYFVLVSGIFFAAQTASSAIAVRMFLHAGTRWELHDAGTRHRMIAFARDSILAPLSAVVPAGGTIPQMLGGALEQRFPNLQPLWGLSLYQEAADVAPDRFRWVVAPLVGDAAGSYGGSAEVVTRMRGVVDSAFASALHQPSAWRDAYFSPGPLESLTALPVACGSLRRSSSLLSGDVNRRHALLLEVGASTTTATATVVRVAFRTDYRVTAGYEIAIGPALRGCVRVELLNLPELALSDSIVVLGIESNTARHVELLGLFPPAASRR